MAEKYKYEIKDRDYFFSRFQDFLNEGKLNESTGGYLMNLLADLEKEIESIPNLDASSVKSIKDALNNLEKVMRKNLKGKGLSGW